MKAVRVHQFGGSEVLRYEDVPTPEPGAGEARVKLEAVGVNFIDVYNRIGRYAKPLPLLLGEEAAGTVDATGTGVTGLKPGDRVVYAMHTGAYAQYANVPAGKLVPVPDGVDMKIAAAVFLQGMTAHYLAYTTYPIKTGDVALIHAAAGGTGALLVQIAKRCGARVIGTVSTEEKAKLARDAGADEVINYETTDFEQEVKRLTDGKGVNVVYDSVGKTTFDKSVNCLRPLGYMVLFGHSSGVVPPIDPLMLMNKGALFLTRPTLGHYIAERDVLLKRAGDLFGWIKAGKLDVRVAKTFPLAEAGAAHDYLEGRKALGKILLLP